MLSRAQPRGKCWAASRTLRASDIDGALNQDNNPEWKTVAFDENSGHLVVPQGAIGFRWGEHGRWNLEFRDASSGRDVRLRLTLGAECDELVSVIFPQFATTVGAGYTCTKCRRGVCLPPSAARCW